MADDKQDRQQMGGVGEMRPAPKAEVLSPGAADELATLKAQNQKLRDELAKRPDPKDTEHLRVENDLLKDQLAKVPPQGPPKGTVVHFRRGAEAVCRPALIASDGFLDSVRMRDGSPRWHALLQYGEPFTEPQRGHSFTTNRGYDPGCSPDTWHAPDECSLGYQAQTKFPAPPRGAPEQAPVAVPTFQAQAP